MTAPSTSSSWRRNMAAMAEKQLGVCAQKEAPVAAFPAHWAPNDMLIYEGSQFPSAYKDGAFIAFHGSWNRAPEPQGGYNVVFQPLADGKASGRSSCLRTGLPARSSSRARRRIARPGWRSRPTVHCISPTIRVAGFGTSRSRVEIKRAELPRRRRRHQTTQASTSGNPLPPEGIHPNAGAAALPIPPGSSPDQVALGDRIFHGQADGGTCSGCHGTNGKGSAIGSDLTDGKWLWGNGSVAAIDRTIAQGVPHPKNHTGAMPPMGGAQLSQADLAAVADYVWAIGHQKRASNATR